MNSPGRVVPAAVQGSLFTVQSEQLQIAEHSWLFKGFAVQQSRAILDALHDVLAHAPLRKMPTARGWMSVSQSNCGAHGWISDRKGYRYTSVDPLTGLRWPDMPAVFYRLAVQAASLAGFSAFDPQACLINEYAPGARMGLHQDRDEADLVSPIVSVSLGLPATFLFGGNTRSSPVSKINLEHGDVLVWGGSDRLRFHGVMPVKAGLSGSPLACRVNLTFRRVT